MIKIVIKFQELKGTNLKRDLSLKRAGQQWHNKNNSGGNFGINMYVQKGENKQITGYYNTKGDVFSLRYGSMYGLGMKIITKDNYTEWDYGRLIKFIREDMMGRGEFVENAKPQRSVSDRNKGNRVENINGIDFVNFTHEMNDKPMNLNGEMVSPSEIARRLVRARAEQLKKSGIKRVEFDTIGGYSYRGIGKSRFIPITTMHSMRLMGR